MYAIHKREQDDSSQTYSSLEFCTIILQLGFGVGVLGFWAWDEFWERIVTDSTWIEQSLVLNITKALIIAIYVRKPVCEAKKTAFMAILCPCLCSPIYGMCCCLWVVISYVCCDLLSLRICCNVQRIMGYVVVCFVLHVYCRLCLRSLLRIMSRRRQIHTGRRLY